MTPLQERIYQQVIVEDECWIWKGAEINGQPVMWFQGKSKYVRRHLAAERGMPDSPSWRYPAKCGHAACVAPDHIRRMTIKQFYSYISKRKTKTARTIEHAKIAGTRRANSLLTDDQVRYIRENPDKLSDRLMGIKMGCSSTLIFHVRHHNCYKDHRALTNPFDQLIKLSRK
jgi:hypothetical protein